MCHYSVGYNYCDIKTTMQWQGEQHKRQRILRYEKTGFWVVGKLVKYYILELIKVKKPLCFSNLV